MKRFRFEMGGSFLFHFGDTIGEAIASFLVYRPQRLKEITAIIEEPIKDYERP
jgi:hypothetical protein